MPSLLAVLTRDEKVSNYEAEGFQIVKICWAKIPGAPAAGCKVCSENTHHRRGGTTALLQDKNISLMRLPYFKVIFHVVATCAYFGFNFN